MIHENPQPSFEERLIKIWYWETILQLHLPVQLLRGIHRFFLPHGSSFFVGGKDKVILQQGCSFLHVVLGRNFIIDFSQINDQGLFHTKDRIGCLEWIAAWV
jgi:hypothetical protein